MSFVIRRAVATTTSSTIKEGISRLKVIEDNCSLKSIEAASPSSVVVEVKASCINYPDLLMLCGKYQHKPSFPFTPGMEWAGTIIKCGEEARRAGWQNGDDVMGSGSGLASVLTVPNYHGLKRIPSSMSYAHAASFWVGFSTAYHCLIERANLQRGEYVLVNGATGGVGMAAVLLAKKVGARVLATGGSDAKLEQLSKFANIEKQHCINYTSHADFSGIVKSKADGRGVNVVFDPVGGASGLEALRSTAWGARYLIVGFTSGTRQVLKSNYVLIKGLTVMGCRAGEYARRMDANTIDTELQRQSDLLGWAEDGLLPFVCRKYKFTTEGVQACFMDLLERRIVGRAVITLTNDLLSSRL